MQNAPKKRVFAIDFQIANTRYGMIEHLPPVYGRRLDNYRSWRNNRSRCNNDRSGGYNRRCGSDNNGSRSNDIAHDGCCSYCRSSDSPSAVVTVMMVVVMMTRHMMMARSMMEAGAAMETVAAMMPTGAGECETSHCHCCDHYCQFLVHVFLLFLSLLTSWLGNVTLKI